MTQSELKTLLDYNHETGIFTWRQSRGRVAAGQTAGAKHCEGYVRIKVLGSDQLAHRLAFFWMTGAWPEHEIDHINGVRDDNRWINLRDVPHQANAHNIGGPCHQNKLGAVGVITERATGRFRAVIKLNGKNINLGTFGELWEASAAYLRAKNELHPTHQRLR